jgi:hypothetical protein
VLAALSFPAPPYPSPGGLAAILTAFVPSAIILSTAKGVARVTEGVRRLTTETIGRLSLLADSSGRTGRCGP